MEVLDHLASLSSPDPKITPFPGEAGSSRALLPTRTPNPAQSGECGLTEVSGYAELPKVEHLTLRLCKLVL